jgi:hypothetical protein
MRHESIQLDFRESSLWPGPDLRNSVLRLGIHKSKCSSYEHERRELLCQDHPREIAGAHIDFNLEGLVNEVHAGPRAEAFVVEAVESIVERFQLRKTCKRSELLGSPPKDAVPAS